jgi:general secretion pathway protein M
MIRDETGRKLSPAISRAAALAILLALIAILYLGIAMPIVDAYQSIGADTVQLQEQLRRYQRAAGDRAQRQAELAALEHRSSAADGFLQGANDTLVAVQIQNRLKSLADAAHAELRSTQVLPAQDEGALRRISVRGQFATTMAGALQIFHGFESQYPLLFVDNLDIRSRQGGTRETRGRGGTTDDSDALDLQFDIYGYTQRSQ